MLKTILKLSTAKVGGDKRTWEDYLREHKVENRLFFLLVDSAAVSKGPLRETTNTLGWKYQQNDRNSKDIIKCISKVIGRKM